MVHRIGKKKYRIFGFDIESHNDDESIAKKETSMWLGCFIDETNSIDDESSYVYTMRDFILRIKEEVNPKRKHGENRPIKNICVYVYNFSFEWSFILPVLLNDFDFKFKSKINDEDEYVFNSVSTKSCSSVWQAQLKFNKSGGIVIFRDLSKIYGGGLGKVAKAFELPTQKGEIDYRLNRLHGHVVTKEEKEYCFKDTRIIVDILLKLIEKSDKDFFNAVSMASYAMKKMIRTGYHRSIKPMKEFRKEYPLLESAENDFLRRSVGGGICYPTRNWQFKQVNQRILHIDAHQMHPSQCYFHLFPYGKGTYFTGRPIPSKICCCRIRITYDDVKLHSIIKLIGMDFVQDFELVVWDFEIPTMRKAYVNLEVEYIDGYAYDSKPLIWRKFYADNYDERLKARAKGDNFNVLYYKLLNNSSYGKLLEKPHNDMFVNIINEEGIIDSEVMSKDTIEINAKYTYLPVGSAIPAYSRVNLIEKALLFGYENVLYLDTDSIFVILNEKTQAIWDNPRNFNHRDYLGGWGLEEIIDRAQFTAPKRYKTEVNGETSIKAGGINFSKYKADKVDELLTSEARIVSDDERQEMIDKYQIPYDEVNIVSSKWKVQRAFRCKGGTLIIFQEKEMAIQKKYESIYSLNMK